MSMQTMEKAMKRNYITDSSIPLTSYDLISRTIYHEAGHAAAIYLYNKQQQFPPIHFRIAIEDLAQLDMPPEKACKFKLWNCVAKVEGGRLTHLLPAPQSEDEEQKKAYLAAIKADIVNLLVGPLAEAKYVALCDDENFSPLLVNVNALKFYGGSSDLEKVNEYLECFFDSHIRCLVLAELFDCAFAFISDQSHWKAIETLADHILLNNKQTIDCEEVIQVIDQGRA